MGMVMAKTMTKVTAKAATRIEQKAVSNATVVEAAERIKGCRFKEKIASTRLVRHGFTSPAP